MLLHHCMLGVLTVKYHTTVPMLVCSPLHTIVPMCYTCSTMNLLYHTTAPHHCVAPHYAMIHFVTIPIMLQRSSSCCCNISSSCCFHHHAASMYHHHCFGAFLFAALLDWLGHSNSSPSSLQNVARIALHNCVCLSKRGGKP